MSFALHHIDAAVAAILFPLAVAILLSGLDDLIVDVVWFGAWIKSKSGTVPPCDPRPRLVDEKRIAIFVPLWKEHAVIRGMLEHNIGAINYRSYDFFVGVYPNDDRTLDAVREVEQRYPQVHLAICPHDGPTSKADCLNWIYQRMLLHEEEHTVRYEVIVTHDAEDLIHPEAMRILSEQSHSFDMVQIPVLALPTPVTEFVHGIYCDEFAEFQIKDMTVRRRMGSFTPSSGVGTGFAREALEKLAATSSNRIFEPACLTEDYENGMRLHELGCPQAFVPLASNARDTIATREYFPRKLRAAIRQRTRWVTGIALQTWERHGWRGSPGQKYWLWRDRKGLVGNPLSLIANLVFLWMLARRNTIIATAQHPAVLIPTFFLMVYRTVFRMVCSGRLYGFVFALGVPIRCVYANFINTVASLRALWRFSCAKIRHEPLVWLKTEHGYPSRTTLLAHKRRLGEILTGSGYITVEQLEEALQHKPADMRLGTYLVKTGVLSEQDLYQSLSLQQGVPTGNVDPAQVAPHIARSLPIHVMRNWKVLPFRITSGNLHLATPEVPTDEMTQELRGFTGLEVRFQLVTNDNFEELLELL